jgi:hypothetical protein
MEGTEALRSFVAQGDTTVDERGAGHAGRGTCGARAQGGTEALRSFVAQGDRDVGRAVRGICVAWGPAGRGTAMLPVNRQLILHVVILRGSLSRRAEPCQRIAEGRTCLC